MNNIKKFNKYLKEEIEINPEADEIMDSDLEAASDYFDKLHTWTVSYTNKRGMDFDLSISAKSLDDLISKLKKDLTNGEYESIFKIQYGTFIKEGINNLFDPRLKLIEEIKNIVKKHDSITTGEIALESSPIYKDDNSTLDLVERFNIDNVTIIRYDQNSYEEINQYEVPYEELDKNLLEEIRNILIDAENSGFLTPLPF